VKRPPSDVKVLTKSRQQFYFDRAKVLAQMRLLPNQISLTRIVLIIPIWILYSQPSRTAYWMTLSLLILSYISDYADGVAARKLKQISPLGLILDPAADKLWTLASMILIVRHRDAPVWLAGVVIGRDVVISLMNRSLFRRAGTLFPSDFLGKSYMVLAGLMIIGYTMSINQSLYIGYLLVPLAILTVGNYARRIRLAMRSAAVGGLPTGDAGGN